MSNKRAYALDLTPNQINAYVNPFAGADGNDCADPEKEKGEAVKKRKKLERMKTTLLTKAPK